MEKVSLLKTVVFLIFLCTLVAAQDSKTISSLEVKYRRQIFKAENFSVYLLEIPPNHASLMHKHETDILSIFVSGGITKGTIFGNPPKEDRFQIGDVRFRSAGFTHSTENIDKNMFRSVIFEFNDSMGTINPSKPSDLRYCSRKSETACTEEKYLLCTTKMCVKEIDLAPEAVWKNSEYIKKQMLVAVTDYRLFSDENKSKKIIKRKSGEVEYFNGEARLEWENASKNSVRLIVVTFF
jgi:hypothetical protein